MTRSILKPILFGVLFGAAAFFMPWFLLKTIFFFMFIGFIFRMTWWRGYNWGRWNQHAYQYKVAMADKIRNMSQEEYEQLKNQYKDWGHGNCYGGYRGRGCRGYNDWNCDDNSCENKTEVKKDSEKI